MPQPQQDTPPASIILSHFAGLRNLLDREKMAPEDLAAALNVDIDNAGQLHRRRGFTRVLTGNWHSIFSTNERTLGVQNDMIGIITPGYAFTPLAWAGPGRVEYAAVAGEVYYTSSSGSGHITAQGTWTPWGAPDGQSIWYSPVVEPTDTLGAVRGKLLAPAPVPKAKHICYYRGRIYMSVERVLWATEMYAYDWIDRTRNFMPLDEDITMVQPVADGIYVGTERTIYFLQGSISEGFKVVNLLDVGVIDGADVVMPADRVHPAGRQGPVRAGSAVVFMTEDGMYAGFDSGEIYNLTIDRMFFPGAVRGAGLYREADGVNSYIATLDSAGSPVSQARIGDTIDAQIIRFSGE